MKIHRLTLALCALAMALAVPSFPDGALAAARSLFLNLSTSLFIKGVDVGSAPAGVQAPWAAKVTWAQAPGCPDWGNLSLGFRTEAATGYSFDVLLESATGPWSLGAYLVEADGDRWVHGWSREELLGKDWVHVDLQGEALGLWKFGDGIREPQTVGSICFESSGKDTTAVFWIANLAIHTSSGLREILPLMADADCPPPTSVAPAIRLPAEPRCYMGMGLSYLVKPEGREFVDQVRKLVPNIGVAAAGPTWRPEWQAAVQQARADGIDVREQNGGVAGMAGLITRAHAWGTDPQGRSRNDTPGFSDFMHAVSYPHPTAREAVRRLMAAMRSIGMLDFEQIDYVWMWQGGPWGYGDWDAQAFRTDLQELDEGLRLASGATIRFWDYVAAYGTPRLNPADIGIASWDAFTPKPAPDITGAAAARHSFTFTALTHYEWLRFAQAMGSEAESWGGRFHGTLNPEDVSNGGDYVFWSRLADTGTEYLERFGSPDATESWRHYLPYLRQEATRGSKRLGVIYEVGVGGHGKPYLDAEVAYCLSYDAQASGQFDDFQNEWMGEADWAASQEGYHRDRLQNWLATARAFNQVRADGAQLPPRKALAIGHRCVLHAIGFTPSYLLTMGALNDLSIDCDYADLTMDPKDWERYQVIVYTPWESSRRHLDALARWLDAKPGRTLITHGAVPTRIASGTGYGPDPSIGDGALGKLLGLGVIATGGPAAGTVSAVATGLAGVLPAGQALTCPGGLFSTTQGEALARIGDKAVVTRVSRPNGSRVYYLNYSAGQPETRATDRAILARLLTAAGCAPVAATTDAAYCHVFYVPGGKVAVIWSKDACERLKFQYRSDIDQRMKYHDPTVDLQVRVAAPQGTYRVYDFLSGSDETIAVSRDWLGIELKGRSCALVYFGPDSPAWRAFLARVKQTPRPQ